MDLYKTKFLTLKSTISSCGHNWFYASRENSKNVVVILPVIQNKEEDEILLLITKRPPLIAEKTAEYCVETPAGLVGDENQDETILEAIKRELLEEAGLEAEEIKICLKKVASSSGLTNETSVIAIAYIKDKTLKMPPIDDNGIIVDRVYVKKSKIKEFLKEYENKGYAIGAQTLSALFYLE